MGEGPLPAGMCAEPLRWCGRWTPTHLAWCWMAHVTCGFTCRAIACRRRDQVDEDLAGLLAANEAFYQAFCACDEGAMRRVWGDGPTVKVIHPRSGCIVGRAAVMESWRIVLGVGPTVVRCIEVQAAVAPRYVAVRSGNRRWVGRSLLCALTRWWPPPSRSSVGWVTCLELAEGVEEGAGVRATNIFEKQDGAWKLVHHHGG